MTIGDALSMYLLQLRADGRSAHTIAQYARHIALLTRAVGECDLGALTHQDLARLLVAPVVTHSADGTPKKATTVNAIRSSLRTFFGYLHAAGFIPSNPARLIRLARCGTAPPRGLSEEEQRRLLDALAAGADWQARRDHMLFELMLRSGIRLGSALALDVGDIDLARGELTLRQAKGDRVQVVYLAAGVQAHLAAFLLETQLGPLFVSRHGLRLSSRQAQRRLAHWLRRATVTGPAAPHSLRHGFAMRLYEHTRDVLLVKEALGHRSILSTMSYVRTSESTLRRVLAVEFATQVSS